MCYIIPSDKATISKNLPHVALKMLKPMWIFCFKGELTEKLRIYLTLIIIFTLREVSQFGVFSWPVFSSAWIKYSARILENMDHKNFHIPTLFTKIYFSFPTSKCYKPDPECNNVRWWIAKVIILCASTVCSCILKNSLLWLTVSATLIAYQLSVNEP